MKKKKILQRTILPKDDKLIVLYIEPNGLISIEGNTNSIKEIIREFGTSEKYIKLLQFDKHSYCG